MSPLGEVLAERVRLIERLGAIDGLLAEAGADWPDIAAEREPGRPGRPKNLSDAFIARFAALYLAARTAGRGNGGQPWAFVTAELARRGLPDVTGGQLRNWYRRAVRLGLIESTPRS